jgi:hypothetical protein
MENEIIKLAAKALQQYCLATGAKEVNIACTL